MPKFADLVGTIANSFQIGIGGTGDRFLRFVNGFTGTLSWNPTANQLLKLPDRSGTIATLREAYNYVQSGVPSSPLDGETWQELAGNNKVIGNWIYDAANIRWQSIDFIPYSPPGAAALATGSTRAITFPISTATSILIESAQVYVYTAAAHSAANCYTFAVQRLDYANVATTLTTLSTQNLTPGAGAVSTLISASINQLMPVSTTMYLPISITKIGASPNIQYVLYVNMRWIR